MTESPRQPTHHDALLRDAAALDEALAWGRSSTAPLWHLAIAATRMIQARRYAEALRIYDVILASRTLDLSAYCNALWVVQEDNTGLPRDPERARRYLGACLLHASTNPAIHLNAAGVLVELGEPEAALGQLFAAVYREVDVREALAGGLFAPLHTRARWPELRALAAPRSFGALLVRVGAEGLEELDWNAHRLARSASPEQTFAALRLALDDPDPRLRQHAVRHLCWWREEPEYDWCFPNPAWLSRWHQELTPRVVEGVAIEALFERVDGDLRGPAAHTAMHSFDILCRVCAGVPGFAAGLRRVAPTLAELLRSGDIGLRDQLLDGLFWIAGYPAHAAPLREHLVAPIIDNLTALSRLCSLSDMEKALRDQVDHSVKVLGDLDELGPVQATLRRIVEDARGEVRDVHLRDRLAALCER
ncbi:MAG: hypothetical protein KC486_01090 [Myxococcales bacterium]|nr:hypothetical protein [Myxococcales bacterium]